MSNAATPEEKATHTPGPWRSWTDVKGRHHVGTPECTLADVFGSDADAALFAAAPDLLAACKAQHEAIDRLFAMLIELTKDRPEPFFPTKCGQPWKAAQAGHSAIAKATGETP